MFGSIAMGLTALLMTVFPIWDMWVPLKRPQRVHQVEVKVARVTQGAK
jgi:hypothetical protein